MSDTKPNSESSPASPHQVEYAWHFGRRVAADAFQHLERVGIFPKEKERREKPVKVSFAVMLEISAVLRLIAWQESGLLDLLDDTEVSSLFEAMKDSKETLAVDPKAFDNQAELPPLTNKIFDLWQKHVACSAYEELHTDLIVEISEADEKNLLNELADFLWDHRHASQEQATRS